MAFTQVPEAFLYAENAGADLSAKLNFLAKINTDGTILLATAGAVGFPILEPAVSGKPVTIQVGGVGKAMAGAAFNAGVDLAADANGKLVTAGSGVSVVGHALQAAAADGEIVSYIIAIAASP